MKRLPPCPTCGQNVPVLYTDIVEAAVVVSYNGTFGNAQLTILQQPHEVISHGAQAICDNCKNIRRDVIRDGDEIIAGEAKPLRPCWICGAEHFPDVHPPVEAGVY